MRSNPLCFLFRPFIALLLLGVVVFSTGASASNSFSDNAGIEMAQTKYKVFCGDESHGIRGYTTVYCYPDTYNAQEVANTHNRLNPGHNARVITCN